MDTRIKDARSFFEREKNRSFDLSVRLATLEKDVGEAKYRLSLKNEVEDIILSIQERNHHRTVGMYESLLTQILQEILQNKDKSVALDLGTKAGKPTLDIMIKNGDKAEDVMSGSGGSVANVISAGLRFIALSRMNCRKFIVLDEADCWLAPDRIGQFANVVSKMGEEMGVQSLMISHHDAANFWDAANTVAHLSKKDQSGLVSVSHQKEPQTRVGDQDIALIELKNFMSHEHTVIKMGPGMTVIHGANDIGKSAVVTALHAIAEGSFKKEYVRHGCNAGYVRLTLGNGQVIECQRNVKGTPAIIYRLFEADGSVTHESPIKNDVPQWVEALIGIRLEQDMDIQLGNQKTPVFLLAEPDSRKAAILSVGGELSHLVTMQEKYKAWLVKDKSKVTEGEMEVGALRREIEGISSVIAIEPALVNAENLIESSRQLSQQEVAISALIKKLQDMECRMANANAFELIQVPEKKVKLTDVTRMNSLLASMRNLVPVLEMQLPEIRMADIKIQDTIPITSLLAKMKKIFRLIEVEFSPLAIKDVSIQDDVKIAASVLKLRAAEARALVAARMPHMDKLLASSLPTIIEPEKLLQSITSMKTRAATGKQIATYLDSSTKEMATLDVEYESLIQKLGGVCPACHGVVGVEHVHMA